MILGLKTIAKERQHQENERTIFKSVVESAKIADMFLAHESVSDTHDIYLGESSEDAVSDPDESEKIDILIEQIPEADIEDTEEELIEIIDNEPIDIDDIADDIDVI